MRRSLFLALALSCAATPALAAPDWHEEGRTVFEKLINIPTVQARGEMPKMTTLLKADVTAAPPLTPKPPRRGWMNWQLLRPIRSYWRSLTTPR